MDSMALLLGWCRRAPLYGLLLASAAHAQPAPPTDFSASPGDGAATLQWADPQDAAIERYEVRHGPSWTALGRWVGIPESGASTVRHAVAELANGERHHFELRAVAAVGAGEAARTSIRLAARPDAVVQISDVDLRRRLAWKLGVPIDGDITQGLMATLENLYAGHAVSLAGIEYAVNLMEFRGGSGGVSDLTPLAALTALKTLEISTNKISDLSPLAGLTALTTLSLRNNYISDLSALADLATLTTLNLRSNDISDLSPLTGLAALTSLDVSRNAISDLPPLAGLAALISLDVSENAISDVTPLASLPTLIGLRAYGNVISDLTPLAGLTALTYLDVSANNISDLMPRMGLTALTYLDVSQNNISDVTPLADLATLIELHAHANRIADISSLANLTALARLRLFDNYVTDLSPLVSNQGIGAGDYLNLADNPLSIESVQTHVPTLQDRGATVYYCSLAAPPVPFRLKATPGDGQVTLRWSFDPMDEHQRLCTVSHYEMRTGVGDPVAYSDWRAIDGSSGRTKEYAVTGLENGKRYWFQLRSVGPLGTAEAALANVALAENPSAEVTIPSGALRDEVMSRLGKREGETVSQGDMAMLTELDAGGTGVGDLAGLEHAVNLTSIYFGDNYISNLEPLSGLVALTYINLHSNEISDISPLASLTALTRLDLRYNSISDVSPLVRLTALTRLYLDSNYISDMSVLKNLAALVSISCSENLISDISALVSNTDLGEGDFVSLASNPLSVESVETHISTLQGRGVEVQFDPLPTDVPETPRLLGALAGDGHAALGWWGSREASVMRYEIRVVADDPGVFSVWRSIAGSNWKTSEHTVGLANGARYVVELRAVNVRGAGGAAATVVTLVADPSADAEIPSPTLRAILAEQLGKAADATITRGDMATLSTLTATRGDIADLGWLQPAANLREIDFSGNQISDLSPLARLSELTRLDLTGNHIADVSPLAPLTALTHLDLAANRISDVSSLAGLTSLTELHLRENDVTDISPLGALTALNHLDVANNNIDDVSPLASLTALTHLHLYENDISDISPLSGMRDLSVLNLAANQVSDVSPLGHLNALREVYLNGNAIEEISALAQVLGYYSMVDLRGNPLDEVARTTHVPAMQARGAVVQFDDGAHWLPFFPSDSLPGPGQGFARIINHSNESGVVSVEAIDGFGTLYGPTSLMIGANEAVHFTAEDIEQGSSEIALEGVGVAHYAPYADWALILRSSLDIEVLGYVRTADGLVASMHDLAPETFGVHDVPTFYSGSNTRQASRLRIVNPTGIYSVALLEGVDDAGQRSGVWLSIYPWMSIYSASQLESGVRAGFLFGSLRDGAAKWSLTLSKMPGAMALNVLESPSGHVSNISSWTGPARWSRGYRDAIRGGAVHRIPLFPSVASKQQGILRVVDQGHRKPTLALRAFDATAQEHGPAPLPVSPGATLHFNSNDLEEGNSIKGLPGTGAGVGDWHMELRSNSLLRVLAYARTPDGFVTNLHDVAPRAEDGSIWIPFFNPGSDRDQESRLRLVNWGEAAASVVIAAVDDAGRPGADTVRLTIPARGARDYAAWQLETGNAGGLSGALGDGEGKWRLRVVAPDDVDAMSLLSLPTGHITNLSTTPRYPRE